MEGNDLHKFSKVIERRAQCSSVHFKKFEKDEKEIIEIVWEESSKKFHDTDTKQKHIPDGPKNPHGQWREGVMSREVTPGSQRKFDKV